MTKHSNQKSKKKDSIFLIIFENNDYKDAISRPFFKAFAKQGTLLTNSHGVIHPSQPNYFALTAGDTFVTTDNTVTLDVTNLVDLLENKKISWKAYVENYPGNCFLGAGNTCIKPPGAPSGECSSEPSYVRKHNPFISYLNVQTNPERCCKIVNATQLQKDIENDCVPEFSLYIPNMLNNAHNTNIGYADQYMFSTFVPLLRNPSFTNNRIFIITFDESRFESDPINQIYTAFWGPNVKKNNVIGSYQNHYNLLRTIEDHWKLGTLGRNDSISCPIKGFYKKSNKKKCKIFKIPKIEDNCQTCNVINK